MSTPINETQSALMSTLHLQEAVAKGTIHTSTDFRVDDDKTASFADALKDTISEINHQQNSANEMTAAVDMGKSDDLVGAMVESQKASLSFDALVQIRNRLVQAFDDVIKMPL